MNCVTRRLFPALLGRDAAVTPAHVRAAFLQAQHWLSTDASSISVSEESSGSEDPSPLNRPDPFLSHLQHKTENDLLNLLAHKDKDEAFDDAEDDKMEESISTGEIGGPKGAYQGAEPTRFGDWERGGRCTDF